MTDYVSPDEGLPWNVKHLETPHGSYWLQVRTARPSSILYVIAACFVWLPLALILGAILGGSAFGILLNILINVAVIGLLLYKALWAPVNNLNVVFTDDAVTINGERYDPQQIGHFRIGADGPLGGPYIDLEYGNGIRPLKRAIQTTTHPFKRDKPQHVIELLNEGIDSYFSYLNQKDREHAPDKGQRKAEF